MAEPQALVSIRGALGVAQPDKNWTEDVDRATRYQNRSITAQVCIKAAARIAGKRAPAGESLEKLAVRMARLFMKEADAYIRQDPQKLGRKGPQKPVQSPDKEQR